MVQERDDLALGLKEKIQTMFIVLEHREVYISKKAFHSEVIGNLKILYCSEIQISPIGKESISNMAGLDQNSIIMSPISLMTSLMFFRIFIAKSNNENNQFIAECKKAEKAGIPLLSNCNWDAEKLRH